MTVHVNGFELDATARKRARPGILHCLVYCIDI